MLKTGQKSLLFGVHQFIYHPITVLLGWVKLYGWPDWKTIICIIVHDWGYWFCDNMDDEKGEKHPEFGSLIALKLFGLDYCNLVLYHSRHYARNYCVEPSKLCWPDKLHLLYYPCGLYLLMARLSGELKEYRKSSAHLCPLTCSDKEWFLWIRGYLSEQGFNQKGSILVNPEKRGM